MSIPELSIRRPVFVTCVFILILALGGLAKSRLGVDLYPDISLPVVTVTVPYPGTSPQEMESLVAIPIEDELSRLAGLKTLRSTSQDGVAIVSAEFTSETDIRFAEQKVSQAALRVRPKLPADVLEPIVQSVNPTEAPILVLALSANLPETELFDFAEQEIKPRIAQVDEVGLVEIEGARKRQIEVALDVNRLRARELSASQILDQLRQAGRNMPVGKIVKPRREVLVRTLGEFESLEMIRKTVVKFLGPESLSRIDDVAKVRDSLEDEKKRTAVSGKRALTLTIYRQSGANTVAVVDAVLARIEKINADYGNSASQARISVVHDGAKPIRDSVRDVTDTIYLGVALTIIVVLLFLGNLRSTVITGIAIPNSLLGALFLMWLSGFTANLTTMTALGLAVGLLIDDAIVVRENIFRRMEEGEPSKTAAIRGTLQVMLAVVATTLTVLSVFGPVAFLRGVIGQFFKQFGLTICFAMTISLFDSLTMAPMLSAYFGRKERPPVRMLTLLLEAVRLYELAQRHVYLRVLERALARPLLTLALAGLFVAASAAALMTLPKTFLPPPETGEFQVALETPAGTSLDAMETIASKIEERIRRHKEVRSTLLIAGGHNGESNQATILVQLVKPSERKLVTSQAQELVRRDLGGFPSLVASVQDIEAIGGGGQRSLAFNLIGEDLPQLKETADRVVARLRNSPDIKDVSMNYRAGAPELVVDIDKPRAEAVGVSSAQVGQELRTLIAGDTPAVIRIGNREYSVRVRLREDQRDLRATFPKIYVPNLSGRLIPLSAISRLTLRQGPASIYRQNRARYIQVTADINLGGRGLSGAVSEVKRLFESNEIPLPPGMRYEFVGQTVEFQELVSSMILSVALAVVLMYLTLSSLYESFVVPFSIMLVLPLAACGAFLALKLAHASLDIYSMVGCILLMGVAAKNSILLVDHINQAVRRGEEINNAIRNAGAVRLRPIMMTTFALVAGMLPVALALTESARPRSSMGVAVIGGLVTSTLLSLVVVPVAFRYFRRTQDWLLRKVSR